MEGFSLAPTLQRHADKRARPFLQTGTVPAAPPDSGWKWDAEEAQPLPDPCIPPFWYFPADALVHATQAVKGAFLPPPPPSAPLLRSLLGSVARERMPGPVLPPGARAGTASHRGHGDRGMGGDRAQHGPQMDNSCRPATHAVATSVPPPATNSPPLGPRYALTRDSWRALLSHTREWMATPGARYPTEPVLERLTASTPGVRHVLHRASAPTEQLTDEVLDLTMEPLRVL